MIAQGSATLNTQVFSNIEAKIDHINSCQDLQALATKEMASVAAFVGAINTNLAALQQLEQLMTPPAAKPGGDRHLDHQSCDLGHWPAGRRHPQGPRTADAARRPRRGIDREVRGQGRGDNQLLNHRPRALTHGRHRNDHHHQRGR